MTRYSYTKAMFSLDRQLAELMGLPLDQPIPRFHGDLDARDILLSWLNQESPRWLAFWNAFAAEDNEEDAAHRLVNSADPLPVAQAAVKSLGLKARHE